MSGERIPLTGATPDASFYSADERSTGEPGTSGVSRRVLHGLTIISVLVAGGCSIYGLFEANNGLMMLPFAVVILWTLIHVLLIFFARGEQHEFHPPGWFIFVSSGNIFVQALIVMILTLIKKPT